MKKNFPNILSYISYFKTLIDYEREEEQRRHLDEIKKLSPKQREEAGRAILNLTGKDNGKGLGNTFLIKLRTKDKLPKTEITIGDLVIVTKHQKPTGKEVQATVVEKTSSSIVIAFSQRPPSYHYKENLRLDLFTNDIAFQRMHIALRKLKGNPAIKRTLLGMNPLPEKKLRISTFNNQKLNSSQKEAVLKSMKAKDFFLLHGPPGTGKTTTLVESILQHTKVNNKILVCADSNTAVDNVLEKLIKTKTKVVRIGNPARVDPNLLEHSLDFLLQKEQFFRDAQLLWKEVERAKVKQDTYAKPTKETRRGLTDTQITRAAKLRKTFRGVPAPLLRKMSAWIQVQKQVNEHVRKARVLEKFAIETILSKAQVICCTTTTAGSEIIEDFCKITQTKFDTVFIDEATQAIEPSCLIPGTLSEKIILAGDHKQLPPTVLSQKANALHYSLFERLIDTYKEEKTHLLDTQYRMNEEIMEFSNKEFYNSKLKAHASVQNSFLKDLNRSKNLDNKAILFIDTTLTKNNQESKQEDSTSFENECEAEIVQEKVKELFSKGIKEEEIGIITPYINQVKLLKELLKTHEQLEIKSVDGFQGREKEIIIISFVRSNKEGNLGFVTDSRRLNVALTRAKKQLILIGNRETLEVNELYQKLFKTITRK